jgi:AraC-like DNA-binding protein
MAKTPAGRRSAQAPLPEVAVRSGDPEEARVVGSRVYYPHRVVVQGDGDRFAMRLSAASLGPLIVGWLGYETRVRIETQELGQYQVNVPTVGTMRSQCGSRAIIASPQIAAVYRPDQPTAFEGWSTPAPMLALKITRRSLEHQLEQVLDRPLRGPVDFQLDMDVTQGRGAQWWAMVRSLASDIDDPDSLIRQPLIAVPFAYSIINGLLMAGNHSYLEELTSPATAISADTVRRAREFIEGHAAEPLTVADIAHGAGVGVRGLQHGFHRSLGTTPMQYLRQVRLRHAHQDLRAADPSSATVAEVAARWGFLNQGRFAAQYRERFGVQPAETLRRHY